MDIFAVNEGFSRGLSSLFCNACQNSVSGFSFKKRSKITVLIILYVEKECNFFTKRVFFHKKANNFGFAEFCGT